MRTTLDKVPHCRDLWRFALPKTTHYLQLKLHPKNQNIFGNDVEEDDKGGRRVYRKDIFGNPVFQSN